MESTIKRSSDILFSLTFLIIAFPLYLFIAILIKCTSKGPVFYIQDRIGRNYQSFGCIKFRTMRVDAENILPRMLTKSPELKREFERDFKLRKDPRITYIGRFLRRSSLDELPQFLNVLLGQMSIVGPRPIVRKEIERYGKYMDHVIAVRPGLTGLWQVSGRNNLEYSARIMLDYKYVTHKSILLDIFIILRTFGVLLFPRDRGAY